MVKKQSDKSQPRKFIMPKGHPFVVPVVTFLLLFIFTMIGMVIFGGGTTVGPNDSRIVTVYADGNKQTLPTRAKTVQDLLERLDIVTGKQIGRAHV